MSGIIKGIGKVFKAVGNIVGGVLHAVKKAVVAIWHIPIIRYAIIAIAAYFTAGAALGAFSAAGAAGATTAAGAAAGTAGAATGAAAGAAVGGAGLAAGAAAGATSAIGAGAAAGAGLGAAAIGAGSVALGTGVVDAGATAIGAGIGASAGTAALAGAVTLPTINVVADVGTAAFTGQAVGASAIAAGAGAGAVASAVAASSMPSGTPPSQVASTANQAQDNFSQNSTPSDASWQDVGSNNLQTSVPSAGSSDATGGVADGNDPAANFVQNNPSQSVITDASGNTTTSSFPQDTAIGTNTDSAGGNVVTRALSDVKGAAQDVGDWLFKSDNPYASMAKMQLLSTGMNIAAGLLEKPQPQMQFAGVNDHGGGPGTLIHTTNGGFGLGVGGGQQAPSGVPAGLMSPGGSAAPQPAAMPAMPKGPSLPTQGVPATG